MRVFYTILLIFLCGTVAAQTTRVRGNVKDAQTGEAIPYASVLFPGTTTGITADEQGYYTLEIRDTATRVQATMVGYESENRPINSRAFNQVDFLLKPFDVEIEGVTVTLGPNPAHPILEGVIRSKRRNDPKQMARYAVRTYTKMELDVANMTEFHNKRMQRDFGFIFDHVDTSAMTGQPYLPVMISESAADHYHSLDPHVEREVIRASQTSGINDNSITAQFTGHLRANANFYENFIELFNVQFASPLSNTGLTYYNYFLVDSTQHDGRKTYIIRFHPRSVSTPVLDGEIQIDSADYALYSARVKMAKGVNVNWIRHLSIESDSRMTPDSVWFPTREKIEADFTLTKSDSSRMMAFIGSREVAYSDVRLRDPIPRDILKMDNNVVVSEEVLAGRRVAWDSIRPYSLTDKERAIYEMVDSIKEVPLYRNIYSVLSTVVSGYYNTRYVGFGPYSKVVSFNRLEGLRFQAGARTTKDFSSLVRLSGHLAYGFRDEKIKGAVGVELMFRRQLTQKLTIDYSYDITQLSTNTNILSESNLLSSIFSRGGASRPSLIHEGTVEYKHEWRHGILSTFAMNARNIRSNRYVPMLRPDGTPMRAVNDMSMRIGLRLSKNETISRYPFDTYYLGSKWPVFSMNVTVGLRGVMPESYKYLRLDGRVQYDLRLPPIGQSKIVVEGGKIFGRVPYLLLKLHEGNSSYFYSTYAFSCMNFYEFSSDAWVSLFYEHHFNGAILGNIPLVKKLNWREVFVFKGVYGTLSRHNEAGAIMQLPGFMSSVRKPYLETGFGIENIFRIVRVDCIWRLTHHKPTIGEKLPLFTVNVSMNLKF